MTALQEYFERFFEEKDLPEETWTFEIDGTMHVVDSGTVIEAIKATGAAEQRAIRDVLVYLDFHNRNIMAYLENLARGYAEAYHKAHLEREATREEAEHG